MKKLLLSMMLASALSMAHAVDITPNSNGGSGNIPATSNDITFTVSNGNWVPTITLPATANNAAKVTIQSSAGYDSSIVTTNSDYPLAALNLKSGESYTFIFNSSKSKWIIQAQAYSPNSVGATIPNLTGIKAARYTMGDGNWTGTVTLPVTAANNTVVFVDSSATWDAVISPANIQFASTLRVKRGDSYVFVYQEKFQRWVLAASPARQYVSGTTIATPTSPRLNVDLNNTNWVNSLTLPANAGDRDRIVVNSSATSATTINNTNIDFTGTLKVINGSRYEFLFIKDKNKWVLQAHNRTLMNAQPLNATGGKMPDVVTPITELKAGDGNWTPTVTLPAVAKAGDRVIVRSDAGYNFNVVAQSANFTSKQISKGDVVRFVRNSSNQWTVESSLINMLLTYSDQAVARLGVTAMKTRLLDGVRLTNEASENSLANFYVKIAGWLQRELPGDTLGDALYAGRSDTLVQNARNAAAADAVYYEGVESGCGLAYMNQYPNSYYMIGTGSLNCGTTVMRHEFGHNMGLAHGGEATQEFPYAQGYSALATVMGGNAIPYFSTPRLYTQDLGLALGVENQFDSVRMLNQNADAVSKFK
jgi:hypothetical protein